MIEAGQARRFATEATQDEKLNSVDVSSLPGPFGQAEARLVLMGQLVTEVDKAVEDFITRRIKAAYPDHKLCA